VVKPEAALAGMEMGSSQCRIGPAAPNEPTTGRAERTKMRAGDMTTAETTSHPAATKSAAHVTTTETTAHMTATKAAAHMTATKAAAHVTATKAATHVTAPETATHMAAATTMAAPTTAARIRDANA
jgi:hypothetical protein